MKAKLEKLVLDEGESRKTRMQALWARISCGPLEADFEQKMLDDKDPGFRAWAIRAAGNAGKVDAAVRTKIVGMAKDEAPTVRLQTAIAARKIDGIDAIPTLLEVLNHSGDDKLIPHVVWQNLHPLLEDHADEFVRILEKTDLGRSPALAALMPRVVERILGRKQFDPALIGGAVRRAVRRKGRGSRRARGSRLEALTKKVQTGRDRRTQAGGAPRPNGADAAKGVRRRPDGPLAVEAAALAATLKDPAGLIWMRQIADATERPEADRLKAIDALVAARDGAALDAPAAMLYRRQRQLGTLPRPGAGRPGRAGRPARRRRSVLARLPERWSRTSSRGPSRC